MRDEYGNSIGYLMQGVCEWGGGGEGVCDAHYRYNFLTTKGTQSSITAQLTAVQAVRLANFNGLSLIKHYDTIPGVIG